MKTIQLKTWHNVVPLNVENVKPADVTSQHLMLQCLKSLPVNEGITTGQMRERFATMDKIEKAKGKTLQLEDNEFGELIVAAKKIAWMGIHRCFVEFEDTLIEAAKTK